jgi:hypothetical protein
MTPFCTYAQLLMFLLLLLLLFLCVLLLHPQDRVSAAYEAG